MACGLGTWQRRRRPLRGRIQTRFLPDGLGHSSYVEARLRGEFQAGRMHGHGRFSQMRGQLHEGEFRTSHGQGSLEIRRDLLSVIKANCAQLLPGARSDADGQLSGHFSAGSLNGEGSFVTTPGRALQRAVRVNHQFHGQGRY